MPEQLALVHISCVCVCVCPYLQSTAACTHVCVQAKLIFQQLILAIDFSHMLGVVHRDIRPQVIHVGPSMHIKLAGFGFSRCVGVGVGGWCE